AQVDSSHGRGVIVDQSNLANPPGAGQNHLLVQLPPHRGLVGTPTLAPAGILLRDVAPDSQRSEPVQSRLALAPAPRVAEHGVPAPESPVGDDLLERGVLLDLRPGAILHQLGHQQRAEVALGLRRETLESTEPIELGAGYDQDAFVELHCGPSY